MNLYKLTIKHDSGKVNIVTSAIDEETARFKITEAENCPPWAITKCVLIKKIY
jgi:hypothetical protein